MVVKDQAKAEIRDADDEFGFVMIGKQGTLEIASGASFEAKTVDVGGGKITLSGSESRFQSEFGLSLDGEIKIEQGVATIKGGEPLSLEPDSTAQVLQGGVVRTARLTIDQSAEFTVDGDDSQLILDDSISTGPASDETFAPGTLRVFGNLTVNDDAFVSANRVFVASTGRVDGSGGVIDPGEQLLAGLAFFNQGLLAAGASPGRLKIDGDYVQGESGVMEVEIGGLAAGIEHDLLEITGEAIIDGTIRFQFVEGFAPAKGQVFEFLSIDGPADFSGTEYSIQGLLPGYEYDVAYDALLGTVRMTALSDGTAVPEPTGCVLLLFVITMAATIKPRRNF